MKITSITRIFSTVLAISLIISTSLCFNVAAKSTGEQMLHSFTAGVWKSTEQYTVEADSTATRGNTTVSFSRMSTLTTAFAANNSRAFEVKVYDDDGLYSSDDLIVTYTVNFTGRTITRVWTRAINGSGSTQIDDGSGNDAGELFIKYRMTKMSGDSGSTVGDGFFYYNIKIS